MSDNPCNVVNQLNHYFIDDYFEIDGWDQQDTLAFTFYNCIIKEPFGPFERGQFVDSIDMDFERGTIEATRYVNETEIETIYRGFIVIGFVEDKNASIPPLS